MTRLALFVGILLIGTSQASADFASPTRYVTISQNVNLFGVESTLTAFGELRMGFSFDSNLNTLPGLGGAADGQFFGTLPSEFSAVGLNGAEFVFFPHETLMNTLTVSGNGTHIEFDIKFDIAINSETFLHAVETSHFSGDVTNIFDQSGAVFRSTSYPDDVINFVCGANTLGFNPGDTAGFVTSQSLGAVPEPSSIALLCCGCVGLLGFRRKRA